MVESFSQTSDIEILASIRWPHTKLSEEQRQWILAPLGPGHIPLPNQPIGPAIAALMIQEAHEILDTRNDEREQVARQAITEGYIRTAVRLTSLKQIYPPVNNPESNTPFAVRLGEIEATRRFTEMLEQVTSAEEVAA
jgi:hypothetical protein